MPNPSRTHGRWALLVVCATAAATIQPTDARGQSYPAAVDAARSGPEVGSAPIVQAHDRPRGSWWTLWSRESPHERLIVGMTTYHINYRSIGWANNWAFGAAARGFFGATFITTYGDRGWAGGFERSWLEGSAGPFDGMLGFRAGLMYGYDEELGWLAGETPILPFGQPVLMARAGPVTVDFTYTWVVFSFSAGLAVW